MSTKNSEVKQEKVPEYEAKVPSKAELIAYMEEQIEVNEVRLKLQEINARLVEALLREKEAQYKLAELSHMSQKMKTDPANLMDHVITEEDLENNPELVKEGIKVGDIVKIPKNEVI